MKLLTIKQKFIIIAGDGSALKSSAANDSIDAQLPSEGN